MLLLGEGTLPYHVFVPFPVGQLLRERICFYRSCSELQIRGGIEDNSKIIFLISQGKCILRLLVVLMTGRNIHLKKEI